MSGRDEEPLRDIPVCPICGSKPSYWIIFSNIHGRNTTGWYWLFSDDYLKAHTNFNKVMRFKGRNGRYPKFGNVKIVVCERSPHHQFGKGILTFQEVMKYIRRLGHEWEG